MSASISHPSLAVDGASEKADQARRAELKSFLRARREALFSKERLSNGGSRRRTPGLRREEVAALAGVSVSWYTWLEQGRDIRTSPELIERLAKTLQLTASDTDYLYRLSGNFPRVANPAQEELDPTLQLVVDGYTIGPAFVQNPRCDVIAFNRIAEKVYRFSEGKGPFAGNHVWRGFVDPKRKRLYCDLELLQSHGAGILRSRYASRIGHPDFEDLLRELRKKSPDFVRMWSQNQTAPLTALIVRLRIKNSIGRFYSTRFILPSNTEFVIYFLVPADSQTARLVRKL